MSPSFLHSPSQISHKNLLVIVQARINSSRLPAKILLPFRSHSILSFLLSRLEKLGFNYVLATTNTEYDDLVCQLFNSVNITRGDENNLYDRYCLALKNNPCDYFVRITADNPLTLIELIPHCFTLCTDRNLNFLQVTGLPVGTCFEIYKTITFLQKTSLFKSEYAQEHINEPYLNNEIECSAFLRHEEPSQESFTIDTIDDYVKVSTISSKHEALSNLYRDIGIDAKNINKLSRDFTIENIDFK